MSDVSGVSGPSPVRIETDSSAAGGAVASGPTIDTGRAAATGPAPPSRPLLPPPSHGIDYGLASSATQVMGDNVAVDFGHIAALMMEIDSELARAARDSQVEQIESVASQMHAAADDIRESAKMALAGGVVSGATQVASAGISIGGGIKGMSLTKSTAAMEPTMEPGEPLAPGAKGSAPAAGETVAPAASAGETVGVPESSQPAASETRAQQVRQQTTRDTVKDVSSSRQKGATTRLDQTLSQQLSARAQNVALMTEGLSKMTSATGEMIRSAMDYQSRQKDADSKEDEARADEQRAHLDRTKGFADSMQKGAQDMLQAFQQMEEGAHQTNKQIWSRA